MKLLFWSALVIAFAVAVWPSPILLPGNPSDKLQHLVAFAGLTGLAGLAHPRTRLARMAVGMALFGALIEIVQSIPGLNRQAELLDWIADIAGIALAIAALWLLRCTTSGLGEHSDGGLPNARAD